MNGSSKSIVLAGTGGQGIILAAEILTHCAMQLGFDARSYGDYGMARRGGAVTATVRFGKEVHASSPLEGTCDILIGLELIETVRNVYMLKTDGTVVSDIKLVKPAGAGQIDLESLVGFLKKNFEYVFLINGTVLVRKTGRQTLNMTMLGCACATGNLGLPAQALKDAIDHITGESAGINIAAFDCGFKMVTGIKLKQHKKSMVKKVTRRHT